MFTAAFAFAMFAGAAPARADADPDAPPTDASRAEAFFRFDAGSNHTNNWAVLVDTSRYWFNYRHVANTLSFYRTVKRLGIPDSRIILMLADDMACNPRNAFPGAIFGNVNHEVDLYGENVEVDYRGYEVTPENLIRVLTDRHPPGVPRSKRLLTDAGSNVLLYLTGHGGDEFLKFQDQHEIVSRDIADALAQMRAKSRYNEVLFIADTCQASTLGAQVRSPGVLAVGSSEKGENSYSHHHDFSVGLSVIDRFTYHTLEFMEKVEPHSRATAKEWFEQLTFSKLRSHAKPQTGNYARRLEETRVVDFFGSVTRATPVHHAYDVRGGAKRAPGVAPPRFDPAEEGYRPEGVRVTSIEEAFREEGRGKSVARGAISWRSAWAAPTAAAAATVASVVARRRRHLKRA